MSPLIALALTLLFFFDPVSPTASSTSHYLSTTSGYLCGSDYYRESVLERILKETTKSKYFGHINFGSNVFKVPVSTKNIYKYGNEKFPTYIIIDSQDKIIGVISPTVVDSSVDRIDQNSYRPKIYNCPESSMIYRKCSESLTPSSISGPVGGFQCEENIIRTRNAIKAASWARKLHEQRLRNFQWENVQLSPGSNSGPLTFSTVLAEYVVPVTTSGALDEDGVSNIAIALDGNFNIIGAIIRKFRKNIKCTLIKRVPPKLIGPELETRPEGYDEYECEFGYIKTSDVIKRAGKAWAIFEAKDNDPGLPFPRLYPGSLFPHISDTLYYIPSQEERESPVLIVMTRSCDVAGVMEITPQGFSLCSRTTTTDQMIRRPSSDKKQINSLVRNERNV